MKWGRQRYFKQARKRRAMAHLRNELAQGCGVPYDIMFGGNKLISNEGYKELKEINSVFIKGAKKILSYYPKKERKRLGRVVEKMRIK